MSPVLSTTTASWIPTDASSFDRVLQGTLRRKASELNQSPDMETGHSWEYRRDANSVTGPMVIEVVLQTNWRNVIILANRQVMGEYNGDDQMFGGPQNCHTKQVALQIADDRPDGMILRIGTMHGVTNIAVVYVAKYNAAERTALAEQVKACTWGGGQSTRKARFLARNQS